MTRTGVSLAALALLGFPGAMAAAEPAQASAAAAAHTPATADFERDRQAILAMAGDYKVTFDFRETVALADGYELKPPKLSGGYEIVRVIEDRGDFISLQHILVVGEGERIPIKHWRQDWTYEPKDVLTFAGGAAWRTEPVDAEARAGAWSQEVYQVDDAPRYGAVGRWRHLNGVSEWTPPSELRPLPRRDATTRDDYHAIDAVNRHVITPWGWVHEQDNTKLHLAGAAPVALAREVGVNTYRRDDGFATEAGERYWAATAAFWSAVRAEWARLEAAHASFGLTIQGEPEALYQPILALAEAVAEGRRTAEDAAAEARAVIAQFTTTDPPALRIRLAEADG